MTGAEKYLYHQIHPLKLAADLAAGFGSLYPLWQHRLLLGLLIMLIPPLFASFLVIRFAALESQKQSAFGRYIAHYMTHPMEAARLGESRQASRVHLRRCTAEEADHRHSALLRARGEWPRRRRTAHKRDERASSHVTPAENTSCAMLNA